MKNKPTPFSCKIRCVDIKAAQDLMTPDVDYESLGIEPPVDHAHEEVPTIPTRITFFLDDVRMWRESHEDEYPVFVYFYNGDAFLLSGISYNHFDKVMNDFLGIFDGVKTK